MNFNLSKESRKAFNEMDANCNACKHFNRLKSDNAKGSQSSSNFVYGECKSDKAQLDKIPYNNKDYPIMVHVADWLGMPCWESR